MNKNSTLTQLIYASAAKYDFDVAELHILLEKSRRENLKNEISGMLLYQNQSFFQVLEGPEANVAKTYERINADPRHAGISKLLQLSIEQRAFSNWTMGHARVTLTDLSKIEGLNDFFRKDTQFIDIGKSRAIRLLSAFRDGEWRALLR